MIRTLLACTFLMSTAAFARQDSITEAPSLHDVQLLVMEGTKPLPEHDRIRTLIGSWNYFMLVTMPGMPAMRTAGTSQGSDLLGGRFVQLESTSNETPHVSSLHIFGYDGGVGRKSYFVLTLDTLGQYFTDTHGGWDQNSASLELRGEEMDSFTGLMQRFRQVYSFLSEDTITCEVFIMPAGSDEEVRMATIVYERQLESTADTKPVAGTTENSRLSELGVRSHQQLAGASITTFTAKQIQSMDRASLQSSILQIMRARTLDDIGPAIRASLDSQYDAAMSRLRSMRRGDTRSLGTQMQPTAPGLPVYSEADLKALDPAEARRALMEVATARRDPKLAPEERARLRILFRDLYDQIQETRRTRPSDLIDEE
tara:strand:+ start:364 stop:1476 length:1113 start_codon:yes stop_codon:yes gene_type:complete